MFNMVLDESMNQKGFPEGNRILRDILRLGVSKYRVSRALDVTYPQVRKWELNYASPNLDNLNKLKMLKFRCIEEKKLQEQLEKKLKDM